MQLKLPPANRIVAFAGPYISLASGAIATLLMLKVHLIGAIGLQQNDIAKGIAYVGTAALGAGLPHLGMQKWLDGHQAYFENAFDLIKTVDPELQSKVLKALPEVEGDILAALNKALEAPPMQAQTTAGAGVDGEDASGDVEQPNSLIDVEAPPLDELPPAESFGDDAVHAPPGTPGAERVQQPAAPQGGAGQDTAGAGEVSA